METVQDTGQFIFTLQDYPAYCKHSSSPDLFPGPLVVIVTIKTVPADFQNSLLWVAPIKSYSNTVLKKPEIFVKALKCPLFFKANKSNFYISCFLKVDIYPYVYVRQYLII